MRARQAFFAVAIFLGCAAVDAAASPLIPVPSGAFLQANRGLDTVRWRHRRYRDFFWRERGDTVGRSDADAFSSGIPARGQTSSVLPPSSEIFGLNPPRRRGWVDPPPPR
jgi:hypothetical protein